MSKWKKIGMALAGTALALNAPVVPEDMKWVSSYETVQFETADGDLGMDEYAVSGTEDGETSWYVRHRPKSEDNFQGTTDPKDIEGKSLVGVRCERCAFYSEFRDARGDTRRVPIVAEAFRRVHKRKDAPQPAMKTLVSPVSAGIANAAIAFDATANDGDPGAVSSGSFSHTTAGSDRVMFVGLSMNDITESERGVASVDYNGDALTEVRVEDEATDNFLTEGWYLVAPDTGTLTVSYTLDGTNDNVTAGSITLTGVDQTTALDSDGGQEISATADKSTATVNSIADSVWFATTMLADISATTDCTPLGTGHTERWDIAPSNDCYAGSTLEGTTTPAVNVIQWDGPGTSDMLTNAIVAVGFAESGLAYSRATTTIDDAGANPPSTPANLLKSDGAIGTWTVTSDPQYYSTFGLYTIPSTDTIDGIKVRLHARDNDAVQSCAAVISLSWDGGTTYTSTKSAGSDLTTALKSYTLGDATDTWGRSWTPAELNNTNFRMKVDSNACAASVIIDYVAMYVYHSAAAASDPKRSVTIEGQAIIGGQIIIQ